MSEPKLPYQWNAAFPCRQEDGWRKCNLTHNTYKDDWYQNCIAKSLSVPVLARSQCLQYNDDILKYFPHYYKMTNELPPHTEICVPRNHDLKLYCNLTQEGDGNLCSSDEMFSLMEGLSYFPVLSA